MPRAGLDAGVVTLAGAAVADQIGLTKLSMNIVAEHLGVKAPSLYKHVDSLAALVHRIATLAVTELSDAIRDATQGRAGRDALAAAAHALRTFVNDHPGRYAATVGARASSPADPLAVSLQRSLDSFSAVLRGYPVAQSDENHALRLLRSSLHGFAMLEASDGFQLGTDIDASFDWMIAFLDQGLSTTADPREAPSAPRPRDERVDGALHD